MPPVQELVGVVLSLPCLLTLLRITAPPGFLFLAQRLVVLEIWITFQWNKWFLKLGYVCFEKVLVWTCFWVLCIFVP